jgi:hypothetical protein
MAKAKRPKPIKVRRTVPRVRAGGEWTESQYWAFIRRALRDASRRYPPIVRLALDRCKRPSQSENKRLKWEHQCAACGLWYPRKHVRVDHIYPVGSLNCYDDAAGYLARLFCEVDELRVLCVDCDLDREGWDGESKDREIGGA